MIDLIQIYTQLAEFSKISIGENNIIQGKLTYDGIDFSYTIRLYDRPHAKGLNQTRIRTLWLGSPLKWECSFTEGKWEKTVSTNIIKKVTEKIINVFKDDVR